ncbi:MAG TPA: hypothetical protein VNC61_12805 [Acidimicrobiales bacterium]|nr:hypothetical protein [Acidimicrobiales bacterium]
MPAETHQVGREANSAEVRALLWMLLGDRAVEDPDAANGTLAELGVDAVGVMDLWAAVCEEFGDRSLGPEIDLDALDPNMTVTVAAATMARLLRGPDDGD